jgi:hypothetical protein
VARGVARRAGEAAGVRGGGTGAVRERRRAGGASVRAVTRESWRCVQVLGGGAEWALEHGCAGMTRQGWSKHGADAGRFQTREQQSDAGKGRARFGCARMEVRRGGSGRTRTKGNEVAHGSTLARTIAEGSTTWKGRSKRRTGSRRRRRSCAGQRRAIAQCTGCAGKSRAEAEVANMARRDRNEKLRRCADRISVAHVREQKKA